MAHSINKEQLSALLDGELSDAERETALKHLDECEECRTYFAELTALHDALGGMAEIEPPEGFAEGVMARLHSEKTRKTRRVWRGWAALAASAAAIVLLVGVLPRGGSDASKTTAAPMERQSVSATASAPAEAEEAETTAEAAELPEAYLETELLFAASGASLADDEAAKSMDALAALPDTDYGGVESVNMPTAAPGGASEPAARTLTGTGAHAWLAERGWQGESGDWYADAADLRALPEGLTLDAPLPEGFSGAVLVWAEEPPEEPVAEAVEEPAAEIVAENTEPPTEAEEVSP